MFEEQLAKRWPGLALEVEEICSKLNLPKLDSCWLDAKNFRKLVTSACHSENEKRLRKMSENIKKCKNIKEEKYGKQNYVLKEKLQVARNIFKTRYGMTEFAANFKNNLKYKKNNWMCFCQEEKESEDHLLRGNCKVYSDLLEKTNLSDDKSTMMFFQDVIKRREELEEGMVAGTPAETVPMPGGGATDAMMELATPAVASQLGGRDAQLAVHH